MDGGKKIWYARGYLNRDRFYRSNRWPGYTRHNNSALNRIFRRYNKKDFYPYQNWKYLFVFAFYYVLYTFQH